MILRDYTIQYRYGEKVEFAFWGDVHWEAINCQRDKVKRDLRIISKHRAKVFGMGDYFECMTPKDFRYRHENFHEDYRRLNPEKAMAKGVAQISSLLRPLDAAGQLLGLLSGNHEKKLATKNEIDLHWSLCNAIRPQGESEISDDVRHPLDLGYNCAARIRFQRIGDNNEVQRKNIMVFKLWHGKTCPATRESKMTKLIKHSQHFMSDLHVVGHWHDLHFDSRLDYLFVNPRGELKLSTYRRYYGISGCYYKGHMEGVDGYVDECDYPPTELGMLLVAVDPETGKMNRVDY